MQISETLPRGAWFSRAARGHRNDGRIVVGADVLLSTIARNAFCEENWRLFSKL